MEKLCNFSKAIAKASPNAIISVVDVVGAISNGQASWIGGRHKTISDPFIVYPEKGKPFSPKLPKPSGYETEIRTFAAWVGGEAKVAPVTAESARDSVAIVDAERKSARTGKPVRLFQRWA